MSPGRARTPLLPPGFVPSALCQGRWDSSWQHPSPPASHFRALLPPGTARSPSPRLRGDPFRLLHPRLLPRASAPGAGAALLRLGIPAHNQIPAEQPEQRPDPVAAGHLCCKSVLFMLN